MVITASWNPQVMQWPPSYVSRGLSMILALNSLVLPIRMVDVWFAPLRGLCPNGKISNYPGSFCQCATFEINALFLGLCR